MDTSRLASPQVREFVRGECGGAVAKVSYTLDQAVRLLREVVQDSEHKNHDCGDADCIVGRCRQFLSIVDGKEGE